MIALIDADSLIYVIAYAYREAGTENEVKSSCDNFLKDILAITQSTEYLGAFSPPRDQTFRNECYNYAPYKGSRPPKPEFIEKWETVIKTHFIERHNFCQDYELEADDVIAGVAVIFQLIGKPCIICSPDKDLRQVQGLHYDYRKQGAVIETVTGIEAHWAFWTQMLPGDDSDNVKGVPGLGPVKASKIIEDLMASGDKLQTRVAVLSQYTRYFGTHYGSIIFHETEKTLRLMVPVHPLYPAYAKRMEDYAGTSKKVLVNQGFFDIPG